MKGVTVRWVGAYRSRAGIASRIVGGFLVASIAVLPAKADDPDAASLLAQSIAAMGAAVPTDLEATGAAVYTAGSDTQSGPVRLLTRGLFQTSEEFDTPSGRKRTVYSSGKAGESLDGEWKEFSRTRSASSRSPHFPLAMLAGNSNEIHLSVFAPADTLAALLANKFPEASTREVGALMYAALVLLGITLVVNVLGAWVIQRTTVKGVR